MSAKFNSEVAVHTSIYVRSASNNDQIIASQRTVATCQQRPTAMQQTTSSFDQFVDGCATNFDAISIPRPGSRGD